MYACAVSFLTELSHVECTKLAVSSALAIDDEIGKVDACKRLYEQHYRRARVKARLTCNDAAVVLNYEGRRPLTSYNDMTIPKEPQSRSSHNLRVLSVSKRARHVLEKQIIHEKTYLPPKKAD